MHAAIDPESKTDQQKGLRQQNRIAACVLIGSVGLAACGGMIRPETPHAVEGQATPTFMTAKALLSAASGFSCASSEYFNPIAHSTVTYLKPDGLRCSRPAGATVYFVAYDSLADRKLGWERGEINNDLCTQHRRTRPKKLFSIVAGNWRIASSSRIEVAAANVALANVGASEEVACIFRA